MNKYEERLGREAAEALSDVVAAVNKLGRMRTEAANAVGVALEGKVLPHRKHGRVKVTEVRPMGPSDGIEVRYRGWTKAGRWSVRENWDYLATFLADTDDKWAESLPPITAEMLR